MASDSESSTYIPPYTTNQADSSGLGELLQKMLAHPRCKFLANPESLADYLDDRSMSPPQYKPTSSEKNYGVGKFIVDFFFTSIEQSDVEAVKQLTSHHIISPNTVGGAGDKYPRIPIIAAIEADSYGVAEYLITLEDLKLNDLLLLKATKKRPKLKFIGPSGGHRPNKYNSVMRTPLMYAAEKGKLRFVKLFCEGPFPADHSIVAPDGQTALRLAANNGHKSVVSYLPKLRAGGWKRFVVRAQDISVEARNSVIYIYLPAHALLWYIPKTLTMSIVRPIVNGAKSAWRNRGRFARWLKKQVIELPDRVLRAGQQVAIWIPIFITETIPKFVHDSAVGIWKFTTETFPQWVHQCAVWSWNAITVRFPNAVVRAIKWVIDMASRAAKALWGFITKTLPKFAQDTAIGIWRFVTQTLPNWGRRLAIWVWNLLTVHIPTAIMHALKWAWTGLADFANAIWNVVTRALSLIHSVLVAVITLLKTVTLQDIWNGFCDLLRAIFITVPSTLWRWFMNFGIMTHKVLTTIFGKLGNVLWHLGKFIWTVISRIPETIIRTVVKVSGAITHEVSVLVNPKAVLPF